MNLALPVVRAGCLDAVATYYDLHLDSSVTISTSPYGNQNCSWEQAVYPVTTTAPDGGRTSVRVEEGDIVHIKAVCTDSLLHVTVERIERNSSDKEDMSCSVSGSSIAQEDMACPISESSIAQEDMGYPISGLSTGTEDMACSVSELSTGKGDVDCPISESSTVHFVDRGAMCRLNDAAYHEVYSSAIAHTLRLLQDSESEGESSDITSDSNPDPTGVKKSYFLDGTCCSENANNTFCLGS